MCHDWLVAEDDKKKPLGFGWFYFQNAYKNNWTHQCVFPKDLYLQELSHIANQRSYRFLYRSRLLCPVYKVKAVHKYRRRPLWHIRVLCHYWREHCHPLFLDWDRFGPSGDIVKRFSVRWAFFRHDPISKISIFVYPICFFQYKCDF